MKKKMITSALLLTALGSCATKEPEVAQKPTTQNDPIVQDIGSASESDKETRLKFLTQSITEKRALLLNAKRTNQAQNTEESMLEVEILDNEILLLEAEMFGLQEGMDLNPTEL